jgi:hypothetical protein
MVLKLNWLSVFKKAQQPPITKLVLTKLFWLLYRDCQSSSNKLDIGETHVLTLVLNHTTCFCQESKFAKCVDRSQSLKFLQIVERRD